MGAVLFWGLIRDPNSQNYHDLNCGGEGLGLGNGSSAREDARRAQRLATINRSLNS